jgi:microcystin-dependent protein
MGQPYVGEIRLFAGNFAPAGWMTCAGQLLPISEYETLFNLIGTTYGGDGQSTFALPDLQGRVPIHQGAGAGLQTYVIGETGGTETVTLTVNQIPIHNHAMLATSQLGNDTNPTNRILAQADIDMYLSDVTDTVLANQSIAVTGGSQPHENMAPYLALTFIISLFGVFPSQT